MTSFPAAIVSALFLPSERSLIEAVFSILYSRFRLIFFIVSIFYSRSAWASFASPFMSVLYPRSFPHFVVQPEYLIGFIWTGQFMKSGSKRIECVLPDLELLELRDDRLESLERRELPFDFSAFGGVFGLGYGEDHEIGGNITDVFTTLPSISPSSIQCLHQGALTAKIS
jgi:hypothetical protein